MEQLTKTPSDVRRIVRQIEAQQVELDLLILKEPTGLARECLTNANIHLLSAISNLKDVS